MKWHDLVFSNHPKQRYRRHACFWIAWWLYFVSTFFYAHQGLQHAGSSNWLLVVLVKSFTVLLCHAFIVYTVIYFLLPQFLLKARYAAFAAGLLVASAITMASAFFCYALIFPLLDTAFNIPSVITKNVLLWNSIAAGLLSALKVVMAATSIKLLKRWWVKQKEKERLEKEKIQAELQLLKAQIHPDFLFNSLDNIYSFAHSNPAKASELLLKLSEMLSYMLYECDKSLVPLEKEIKMIKDYMTLEKIRVGPRLEMDIAITGETGGKMIAPLLLLPFIENAFSICNNEKLEKFWINVDLQVTEIDFTIKLINGAPSDSTSSIEYKDNKLAKVQKRMQIVYPGCYELKTTIGDEMMMTLLKIQWKQPIKVGDEMSIAEKNTNADTSYNYAFG